MIFEKTYETMDSMGPVAKESATTPEESSPTEGESSEVQTGVVKWFSTHRGYGFIEPVGSEEDVFVHYSNIVDEENSFKNLQDGDRVEFKVREADKGPEAYDVISV